MQTVSNLRFVIKNFLIKEIHNDVGDGTKNTASNFKNWKTISNFFQYRYLIWHLMTITNKTANNKKFDKHNIHVRTFPVHD